MSTPCSVLTSIEPQMVIEGADVRLLCSIAPRVSILYDPFLLFDQPALMDPVEGPIQRSVDASPYNKDTSDNVVVYAIKNK